MSEHHDVLVTKAIARNTERMVMEIARHVGVNPGKIKAYEEPRPDAKPVNIHEGPK